MSHLNAHRRINITALARQFFQCSLTAFETGLFPHDHDQPTYARVFNLELPLSLKYVSRILEVERTRQLLKHLK